MRKILYISYDGLLDPLGASQILPYAFNIASSSQYFHIISFEKKDRLDDGARELRALLKEKGIHWTPLLFSSRWKSFSKIYDLIKMHFCCLIICIRHSIKIVHARSHLSTQVGCFLKIFFNLKLIFDFRGLWVDERVDKGGWDINKLLHRIQFNLFKRIEKILLQKSDHIVVLTHAVVDEIHNIASVPLSKVTVIPCCADYDHFKPINKEIIIEAKRKLDIPEESLVLGYLGSLGKIYLIDRLFRLLEIASYREKVIHILIITKDLAELRNIINNTVKESLLPFVHIASASRVEVPEKINIMNAMVSFTQPSYARISMSPTKIAECFAIGVPVVVNEGVGDVASDIKKVRGGLVVPDATDKSLEYILDNLDQVLEMRGTSLRQSSSHFFSLEKAHTLYQSVYSKI
jgi:glycosyltransferase involved in cell wall biosynthesis